MKSFKFYRCSNSITRNCYKHKVQTVNGRGRGTGRGSGTSRGRGIPQERHVNERLGRGRGMTQHSQTSSKSTCRGRCL
ncbi:hypothetical protein KY284_032211 [Solanum tuberosum]|nr:hypothetical protein KY284_032211 [Solanum tuberosum]